MTQAQSYEAWRITYQSDEQAARSAFSTAEMLRQELLMARAAITSLERDVSQALTERDDATDFIDNILDEVLGQDRHEWTSAYDWDDALADVEVKMAALKSGKCLHQIAEPAAVHLDDVAVDALAALMKAKLAKQRAKGYGGWNDKIQCTQQRLSTFLRTHVDKGDPVDVANFCAMLSARGEGITAQATPLPLLLRDIARDLGVTVPEACVALKPWGDYSTNSAVTAEMATKLREAFPNPAPQAVQPAVPFMHGIADGCGNAYFEEGCVAPEARDLQPEVDGLNSCLDEDERPYSVVPLYAHPAAQGMDADSFAQTMSDWAHGDAEDAARYHWLREQHDKGDDSVTIFIGDEQHGPGHLDAQIDEAIAAQAKQGGA